MSKQLARSSQARSSQDSTQLRLRRLSVRPRTEKATGEDDQATVKVPISALHYVRRRKEFLIAPRPSRQGKEPREQQIKLPPLAQEKNNKSRHLLPAIQGQPGNNSRLLLTKLKQVDQLETMRLPASGSQDDMSQLDTVALLTPDLETTQVLETPYDDDPEFEQLKTLPMMVLTGISAQQGKPQPEMRSEVSGAAGAASLMGLGSIIGSVLKYIGAFLIQYGFGPGGYGLYTLSLSLVNLIAATRLTRD